MAAVKDHNPLIGSCLDTGHLIRAAQLGKKLDPAQQIRLMGKRNFGIHGVTGACEYLADQGLIGKAPLAVRLTRKSNIDVEELAFFYAGKV